MGTYLVHQPKSGFCFRMNIPYDLRDAVGLRELRYTLHSHRTSEACRVARKLAKKMHSLFAQLRGDDMAELSQERVRAKIRDLIGKTLRTAEKNKALGQGPKDLAGLNDWISRREQFKAQYLQDLNLQNYTKAALLLDDILEHEKIGLDKESLAYRVLCREVLKGMIVTAELTLRQAQGNYGMDGMPFPEFLPDMDQHANGSRQGEPISEVVEKFVAEKLASQAWTPKTESENRAVFKLFIWVEGDVPINTVTRQTMAHFKQVLLKLPPNLTKNKRCRGKSIEKILKMSFRQTLSPSSVNRILTRMSGLLQYAEIHGMVTRNPATKMQLKKTQRDDELRRVFTPSDLKKLFHSPLYIDDSHSVPYSFWVPIIGLFTGMRIEEICQLYLDDIRQEDGVWVFDVNSHAADKKLKTRSSSRLVPLHPFLVHDLHLVEYAATLRRKGEKRLFPELQRLRDGYGQRVSKWFARYRIACGVTEKGKVFHSFRHGLADALKQTGVVDPLIMAELEGHAVKGETLGRYAKRYPASKLLEAIKLLDFGVHLTHLSRSRFCRSE
jgi:integrase